MGKTKLTYDEAVKKYFAANKKAGQTLQRIMDFQCDKSITENSSIMKLSIGMTSQFARKFDIPHRDDHSAGCRGMYQREEKEEMCQRLWDPSLTIKGNSRKLNIKENTARLYAREFQLDYSHHTVATPEKMERLNRIMTLKKKGLKDAEIARFFNYSRERIRQLVHDAKINGVTGGSEL